MTNFEHNITRQWRKQNTNTCLCNSSQLQYKHHFL